jgi:hypothetical protein
MQKNELTTLIAKVEATGPAGYVTDLALLENRFQFRRHIQSLKGALQIGESHENPDQVKEMATQKLMRSANVSRPD